MSEEETFIARWSRRKREADSSSDAGPKVPAEREPTPPGATDQAGSPAATATQAREEPAAPPVDPASLPPLESITSGTDVQAFLRSGVPAELAKAALRRAWAADPAIRDFIEVAENQWDFTNPSSIPGFGPLTESDDVGKLVSQALGRFGEEPTASPQGEPKAGLAPPADPQSVRTTAVRQEHPPHKVAVADAAGAEEQGPQDPDKRAATAVQHEAPQDNRGPMPNRRSHGGALPQ